jgi:hypothetical protein
MKQQDYKTLLKEASHISPQSNLDASLDKLVHATSQLLRAQTVQLIIVETNKKELRFEKSFPEDVGEKVKSSNLDAKSIPGNVALNGQQLILKVDDSIRDLYPGTFGSKNHVIVYVYLVYI